MYNTSVRPCEEMKIGDNKEIVCVCVCVLHVSDCEEHNRAIKPLLYSSEISPTRCNNCVFILRNGFTLHVSGDNLTHHHLFLLQVTLE